VVANSGRPDKALRCLVNINQIAARLTRERLGFLRATNEVVSKVAVKPDTNIEMDRGRACD
jgi:hypothetical protein